MARKSFGRRPYKFEITVLHGAGKIEGDPGENSNKRILNVSRSAKRDCCRSPLRTDALNHVLSAARCKSPTPFYLHGGCDV